MGVSTVTALDVRAFLGADPVYSRWLDQLVGVEPAEIPQPSETSLGDYEALQLGGSERAEYLDARPDEDADPELWWLWGRCRAVLLQRIGHLVPMVHWPSLPTPLGARGRYFFAHVLLSVLHQTRTWHQRVGVSDQVSWQTLDDVTAKLTSYRQTSGVGGLDKQNWLSLHFAGAIFRLGRLQFERAVVPPTLDGRPTPPAWPQSGERALGLHIPEGGPLLAGAVDQAIELARDFFAELFDQERYRVVTCESWLLDDQLSEYLPATAHIVEFRSRFHLWRGSIPGDGDIMDFVFHRRVGDLDGLPQNTTLQRAVVAHLKDGRHWQVRRGWMHLHPTRDGW